MIHQAVHPAIKALEERRKELGWDIHRLAEESGVSPNTMLNWRAGRTDAGLANLEAALNAVGLTLTIALLTTASPRADE